MTTKNPFNSLYYTVSLIALLSFIISLFGTASGDYILFKTGQFIGWTFDFILQIFVVGLYVKFKNKYPDAKISRLFFQYYKIKKKQA